MSERTVEDRLREEYFDLLPEIRRVVWQLETEIRFRTLRILHNLKHHEQLVIKSRVKDCESAIKTLRLEQELRTFDPERAQSYSVLELPDLAGVRVLVFPRDRLIEVDRLLREHFKDWESKPVRDSIGTILAPKYYGFCEEGSPRVRGEYQVVPMLIGLFWEVEHSALYKPDPSLRGRARSKQMQDLRSDVERSLLRFETEFASIAREGADLPLEPS